MPPSAVDTVLENNPQTIVVLSLSEVSDSLLVWGHYAAAHTGFVIGFSSPGEILAIDSPHRHIAKVNDALEWPSRMTFEEITNDELLLTKSIEWEHEQEWRILDSLFSADCDTTESAPDCWLFKFRRESITQVIVGCRASDGFVKQIEHVLSNEAYHDQEEGGRVLIFVAPSLISLAASQSRITSGVGFMSHATVTRRPSGDGMRTSSLSLDAAVG